MSDSATWERQPEEPNDWFDRFLLFKRLGSGRSLLAAYNEYRAAKKQPKANSAPPTWRKAAKDWNWKNRAEAWDTRSQQKAEKTWAKVEHQHQQRRAQMREKSWRLSQELIARAEDMLSYPLVQRVAQETVDEPLADGSIVRKNVTVFAPAKWSARDAVAYLDLADRLARTANDQETQQDKILKAIETLVEADVLPMHLLAAAGDSYTTMMQQMQAAFAELGPPPEAAP